MPATNKWYVHLINTRRHADARHRRLSPCRMRILLRQLLLHPLSRVLRVEPVPLALPYTKATPLRLTPVLISCGRCRTKDCPCDTLQVPLFREQTPTHAVHPGVCRGTQATMHRARVTATLASSLLPLSYSIHIRTAQCTGTACARMRSAQCASCTMQYPCPVLPSPSRIDRIPYALTLARSRTQTT